MSEDEEESGAGAAKPWYLKVVKNAGALAAVLYVFGFLSIRSWLNLLGVWTALPVVSDTYVHEGGAFFVATLEKLIFPWGLLALVVGALGGVAFAALGRRKTTWAAPVWWKQGHAPLAIAVLLGLTFLVKYTLLAHLDSD